MHTSVRAIVIMGVSGSGKTTVGQRLAEHLGGRYFDADDFHPQANVAKMARGEPLDDSDRAPWLARLRHEVIDAAPAGSFTVLGCSALKRSYRQALAGGDSGVALVFLKGTFDLFHARMASRKDHYMKDGG